MWSKDSMLLFLSLSAGFIFCDEFGKWRFGISTSGERLDLVVGGFMVVVLDVGGSGRLCEEANLRGRSIKISGSLGTCRLSHANVNPRRLSRK